MKLYRSGEFTVPHKPQPTLNHQHSFTYKILTTIHKYPQKQHLKIIIKHVLYIIYINFKTALFTMFIARSRLDT